MAYSTKEQIAQMFPGVSFSSTTRVTDSAIDEWIAEADQRIDAVVGLKYQTPITGTQSLLILRAISKKLVGNEVMAALEIKTASEETKQGGTGSLLKEANQMLSDIASGKMILPDATSLDAGGVSSFNADCDVEHTFKLGVEQW